MCKYIKYFSCCVFLVIGIFACTNDTAVEQNTDKKLKAELVKTKEIAQKEPVIQTEKGEKTDNIEKSPSEDKTEIIEKTPEKDSPKETKKERLKREKAERRKKRAKEKRAAAKKAPKMEFAEKSYKFGTIMQGDEVEHVFKFKNTGKSDLVISNVSVTCGCTHPSYPFIPIEPGKEGEIKIHYNSAGKLGPQKPMVTIVSNAIPAKNKIYLEGFVDAERAKPIEKTKKDTLKL